MGRKKPYVSIIIIGNNHIEQLRDCIKSLEKLENVEILIVNNYINQKLSRDVEQYLQELDDPRIVYYQSNIHLPKNNLRNLALSFAAGSWLYFIDDYDVLTPQFVKFLSKSKFNPRINFYRLQIISSNKNKKLKYKFFQKSRFYSMELSTFFINGEWIRELGLQFNDNLDHNDVFIFVNSLYSYKNVNVLHIKKIFAIVHNFNFEFCNHDKNQCITMINDTVDALIYNRKWNYKSFIVFMLFKIYKKNAKTRDKIKRQFWLNEIFEMYSKTSLWLGAYLSVGLLFLLKTTKFRFLMRITKMRSKKEKKYYKHHQD